MSLDDARGAVHAPALLRGFGALRSGETALTDVVAPPMYVDADAAVSDVVDETQARVRRWRWCARRTRWVGPVTATDAFGATTGDPADPLDR